MKKDFKGLWTFLISIVVIAVVAAMFFPEAFQGMVLNQSDMQQGAANGQETLQYYEQTGEKSWWTNSLFCGMPTYQISPSYSSNGLFDWLNTVMGLGLPNPANLLAMMMIGMLILLFAMKMRWYVALIGAVAYGLSTYFVIIIGAGHIWKFVTLAYIPPTIAGMVLAYRGRYLAGAALTALFAMLQIAANHVQMTYYFLFVIAGFFIAFLCQAIREKTWKRFAGATGAMVVAGALAVVANLPNLYNTYEYSKYTMRGTHSELTNPDADASQATSGLDRDYITQYSYGTSETFSLLIPNVKGGASAKPVGGAMQALSLSDLDAAKDYSSDQLTAQYLQYSSQYFGEPEGTNGPVYVGALIFALFIVGCVIVKGPMKWVLIALTLFSVILALGRNAMAFTDFMIDYVPMYAKFRTVESILVIAEFTMPLLAVMALQQLLATPDAAKRYVKPTLWCFGAVLFFCFLAIFIPSVYGNPITEQDYNIDSMITQQLTASGYSAQQAAQFSLQNPAIYSAVEHLRYSMVEADGLRSFLIVGAGLIFIILYFYNKVSATVMTVAVAIFALGDLFLVNHRYLDSDSFVSPSRVQNAGIPRTQIDNQILADTTMNYRVMNIPMFRSPAPSYYHKAVGGYHAAKLTRFQDLIDRHLSHFEQYQPTEADINVLNMLNARYVVDSKGAIPNPEALGNAWLVDTLTYVSGADAEMAALQTLHPRTQAVADKAFEGRLGTVTPASPGDTIFETMYAPDRLTYHAQTARGALAVFSEIYYPDGWKAYIDGKEVEAPGRVNYVLRALPIPAGSHTVEMRFDPDSVRRTVSAATVSIIIIYLLCAAAIGYAFCPCHGKCRAKTKEDAKEVAHK